MCRYAKTNGKKILKSQNQKNLGAHETYDYNFFSIAEQKHITVEKKTIFEKDGCSTIESRF